MDELIAPVALQPNEIRFYRDEGYLYLPGLVSDAAAVARLRAEVLEVLRRSGQALSKLTQSRQYVAGGEIDALVNSPRLRDIAAALMEGAAHLYLPFTAVKAPSGGGRFHFHQDNQYTRFDGPGINLWIALEAMTPENGCLQIVPRSHLNGTLDATESGDGDTHRRVAFEPEQFLPVRMRPGDCVAFSRLTVHGSGANRTDQPRVAYAVQYYREDVRYLKEGEWLRLREHPRWEVTPVPEILPLPPG